MPTLIENLSLINSYKSDIKYAIEKQGVDMTGVSFGSFADKIGEITTEFVTEPLSVSVNGTYTPGQGVDGYSQVNVSVPDGDGTWSNPYNVLDAINVINGSPEGTSSMYVRAFVTAISSAYSQTGNYGNADFHVGISGSNYLRAYRLNYFDGKKYNSYPGEASKPDIHIGDEVIMYGQFKMYNNTPQTVANAAYLYAINGVYDISVGPGTEYYIEQNGYYSSLNYYEYIEVSVPAPAPVTESLSVSVNGTYTPGQGVDGFSQVTVNVPQSVTGYTLQNCIEQTSYVLLSEINDASTTYIGPYAFTGVVYLNYPGGIYTNSKPINVTSISLPNVSVVYLCGCMFNKSLIYVSLPSCTAVCDSAFMSCIQLNDVYLPLCRVIGQYGFQSCTALTTIDLPSCVTLNARAFDSCINLESVSLPVCENIGASCFQNCSKIVSLYLPKCNNINGFNVFASTGLLNLTLGYSSVCVLGNSNAFSHTPIAGTGSGSIYVPASLVDSYKSARNWSVYSTHIFSIQE